MLNDLHKVWLRPIASECDVCELGPAYVNVENLALCVACARELERQHTFNVIEGSVDKRNEGVEDQPEKVEADAKAREMIDIEQASEERVDVGGVRLWTTRQGAGVPVLLSSGGPGCCDYLAPIAQMIDDLAQVYRWEQRGCGRSEAIGPYDQATCIADMEALREHFGYNRWIVGGQSWGANLSLVYALEHPERVQGVIYLSGTGITEDWKQEYRRAKEERGERLPEFAYPYNPEVNRAGNLSRTEYLQNPDIPDRLRKLNIPMLLVHGERDIRPSWPVEQLADLLPDARYVLIPGAEHFLWLDNDEPLRGHLRSFLHEPLKSRRSV